MAKLVGLRRKSAPDAEQLLTPRKNGFFGKRNNGVRSEDTERHSKQPLSARRLVSSVFKGSSSSSNNHKHNKLVATEVEASPLDDSPAIQLELLGDHTPHYTPTKHNSGGTPKTAPPSPDLVVLTNSRRRSPSNNHHLIPKTSSSSSNHNRHRNSNSSTSKTGTADEDGDETIMSDLTGTVSPTPQQLIPPPANTSTPPTTASNPAQLPQESSASKGGDHGVTFAHRQDSFYSAYSPAMGVFQSQESAAAAAQTDGGSLLADNTADGSTMNADGTTTSSHAAAGKDYCKSSMLDQVLGVVDGACHRTMDYTLGGLGKGSTNGAAGEGDSTPQWGMAPSADDDDSTCMETNTMGDTLMGGTLMTQSQYTNTTTDDMARTHGTGTTPTSMSRVETVAEEEAAAAAAMALATAVKNHAAAATTTTPTATTTTTPKETTPIPLNGEPSDLHENFELVLGQTALAGKYDDYPETPKKRGWGSIRLLSKGDSKRASSKNNNGAGAAGAGAAFNEEKKDDDVWFDQRALQTKIELSPLRGKPPSPTGPSQGTPAADVPLKDRRETLYKSVFGDDFTGSPSQDVGVEIQSRRVLQRDLEEKTQLAASGTNRNTKSSPSKKALSGLVKRLKFGRPKVRRTKSTSAAIPKRAQSPGLKKRVFASTASTPSSPALKATQQNNDLIAAAFDPSKSKSIFTTRGEEEKKEIEPADTITDLAAADAGGVTTSTVAVMLEDETALKLNKVARPEITGLSPHPIPLKDRSNSFKVPSSSSSKATVTDAPGSATGSDKSSAKLQDPIPMNRLRSAPVKLSSAQALAQKKSEEEEQRRQRKSPVEAETPKESPRRPAPKLTWKAAVDAQGRTYYYHRGTRKTTWVKPPEFEAELQAVKKFKEGVEAAKKEASETQQVIDGCKNVEAIQASLRKKTQRDFDPQVWQTKQEILDIVKTMPLPRGTNIEKLLVQYGGKEDQLLANLRDLVESKPFDEPFQAPNGKEAPPSQGEPAESSLNISHASSSVSSSAHFQTVDVQHRVRTAVSASTRISEKTYLTEKTEKIRNTSKGPGFDTIREGAAMSTGSISSASEGLPPRNDNLPFDANGRVPSKIPAVPRSRDLKVEEFTDDMIAKETFNGQGAVPNRSAKAVAEQIVALSSLDDDDSSYHADYDDTADDRGNDTDTEKIADSISALSEADADYQMQKENFERARRRALDVAVEREDWDLAAALSEGMKQVKESLYGKDAQREWTQTELDRFISENDWDAVSKYIAHMRDHPTASVSAHSLPNLTTPRGRDPDTGRDPDGFMSQRNPSSTAADVPPPYVSEATKRASTHTKSGRRQQQQQSSAGSAASSQGSGKRAQTRFGARSQLQHSDLNSISSWDNSSSSYESEYSDNSYESEDDQGYISLRVRRNEFEC